MSKEDDEAAAFCEDPANRELKGPPFIRKLDFSEFHPLDHSVWECRGYPGGRGRHLEYRWKFQWRDELHAKFLCPLGRHERVEWFGRGKSGFCCRACCKDME